MRNKINYLLGRNHLKASKLRPVLNLAISRVAVLKNHRQVRFSQAKSDVLELLRLGNHERALLRAELVIKEQNMLDVYDMLEAYCNLLIERLHLIEHERECPEELREAISGMLYAASRCGDFPELHEIRAVLTSHFGKEFAARAIELRNNCGVNHAIILKLSTRQPSLDNRMMVLKEIASENSIVLQLEEAGYSSQATLNEKNQTQPDPEKSATSTVSDAKENDNCDDDDDDDDDDRFSNSVKARKKYKDVADAAQAAFESAAYAAEAARAAVELSRSGHDSDTQDSPGGKGRTMSAHRNRPMKMEFESKEEKITLPNQSVGLKKSASSSTSDSADQSNEQDVAFGDSDTQTLNEKRGSFQSSEFKADQNADSVHQYSMEHNAMGIGTENTLQLNLEKAPFSVRTRRLRGF